MDRDYAYGKEDEGFEKLEHFNKNFLKLENLTRTPKNYVTCDASGLTSIGESLNIEIKVRNQVLIDNNTVSGLTTYNKPYTADTIFIEAHKSADLFLDYVVYKRAPIYINFLANDYVVVYNLFKMKKRPKVVTKKIYSKLYQQDEIQRRVELPLSEAFIYKREGDNYILKYKPNV